MYEIDEDIRVLILMREFPTNSGPIDALGVDANGNIYIVETKLYKNPDKRGCSAGVGLWCRNMGLLQRLYGVLTRLDIGTNKKFGVSVNEKIRDFSNIRTNLRRMTYSKM